MTPPQERAAEIARFRAGLEAARVALLEQVAFHAMRLSLCRDAMDEGEIEDVEYKRDRARSAALAVAAILAQPKEERDAASE